MIDNVIKRDGKVQNYNFDKVRLAVGEAFKSCGKETPEKFLEQLKDEMESKFADCTPTVEEIQDVIRNFLIKKNKYDVVDSFILYRDKRNRIREEKSKLIKGIREKLDAKNVQNQNANLDEKSFGGRIGEASRVVTKEMALNHCMSEKSRKNHINNEIYIHDLDSYAVGMHNCLSIPFDDLLSHGFTTRQTDVRPANSINTAMQLVAVIFQIQSLQQFGGVSSTHFDWTMVPYVRKSFYKHFTDGLRYIEELSAPDVENVLCKIQNTSGDISEVSIDDPGYKEHLKAYKYATDMTQKECHQAIEGMYHNLNTLQSRSGNQLPFSSLNFGTCTLPEGRMVIEELLEVSIEGLGKFGRTSIFPCSIFQLMKGVNRAPGDPNYDLYRLALKSTAQRLYPNYGNCNSTINDISLDRDLKEEIIKSLSKPDREKLLEYVENPENKKDAGFLNLTIKGGELVIDRASWSPKEIYSSMGCRTINGMDINFAEIYKENLRHAIHNEPLNYSMCSALQKDGRGNICPVTIILPTIAMEAKDACLRKYGEDYTVEELDEIFFTLLDKKIGDAKDSLIERFNWICKQPVESAKFMYENGTMCGYKPEEHIVSALKHGTLTIGMIALAETCQIIHHTNQLSTAGRNFFDKVVDLYSTRCKEYKNKYKLNFAVYYTPAENLCYTSLKKFRDKYGIIPNVSDHEYFTNSIHVPVYEDVDAFTKIDVESLWASKGNGGTITYVELPASAKNNTEALETLVNYAMDSDIPYFAINVPNDTCETCGYCDEIGETCPKCGGTKISRLRRVTGYLTGDYKTAFNNGKKHEAEERVKHFDKQIKQD